MLFENVVNIDIGLFIGLPWCTLNFGTKTGCLPKTFLPLTMSTNDEFIHDRTNQDRQENSRALTTELSVVSDGSCRVWLSLCLRPTLLMPLMPLCKDDRFVLTSAEPN